MFSTFLRPAFPTRPPLPFLYPHHNPLRSLPNVFARFRHVLAPRKVKWPRAHKGRLPIPIGGSTKGTTLSFGDYGIRVRGMGKRITAKQLSTAEAAMRHKVKTIKGAKIHLRVFPSLPVGVKGSETRMGKGKGGFEYWACWHVVPLDSEKNQN